MKLACGSGRRFQRVRGSLRCRLDGVRGGKVHRALFSSSQRRGSEFEQAKLGAARGRGNCVHVRALPARQTHFNGLYPKNFNQEPMACLLVSYRPLATRSLNARGALEAAPRGDTSSN